MEGPKRDSQAVTKSLTEGYVEVVIRHLESTVFNLIKDLWVITNNTCCRPIREEHIKVMGSNIDMCKEYCSLYIRDLTCLHSIESRRLERLKENIRHIVEEIWYGRPDGTVQA